MDERGYCTIEGRLKDMIIRGGENIYPREASISGWCRPFNLRLTRRSSLGRL